MGQRLIGDSLRAKFGVPEGHECTLVWFACTTEPAPFLEQICPSTAPFFPVPPHPSSPTILCPLSLSLCCTGTALWQSVEEVLQRWPQQVRLGRLLFFNENLLLFTDSLYRNSHWFDELRNWSLLKISVKLKPTRISKISVTNIPYSSFGC